jgi:small-conductance mechanosensitive channel
LLYTAGVATAFAARDVMGNVLNGFSLQFSQPFSVGEYIKVPYHICGHFSGHIFTRSISLPYPYVL